MVEKTFDITKWKPLDWKWILMLFLVVIVAMLVWQGGNWAAKQITGFVKPAEEGLSGVLPD